ncbi:MAG: hypothetical protein GPJ54_04160 [Candidatus Heimdallarchaeota archaeon]|nr:hypothetical protein [Candidatus Heimdallarchaeota archaeon]
MSIPIKENKTWGYVIYHKSGHLLFDRDMNTISEERGVLTNMINTLLKSSQGGNTVPIEELEIADKNILLSKTSGLPIWHAVFMDKSEDKNVGYKLLGNLIDHFEKLYTEAQEKKIVANFFKYQEFADQVTEIIDSRNEQIASSPIRNTYSIENKKDRIVI